MARLLQTKINATLSHLDSLGKTYQKNWYKSHSVSNSIVSNHKVVEGSTTSIEIGGEILLIPKKGEKSRMEETCPAAAAAAKKVSPSVVDMYQPVSNEVKMEDTGPAPAATAAKKVSPSRVDVQCPSCPLRIKRGTHNLQQHLLRAHLQWRLFGCSECDFRAYKNGDVKGHMKKAHPSAVPVVHKMQPRTFIFIFSTGSKALQDSFNRAFHRGVQACAWPYNHRSIMLWLANHIVIQRIQGGCFDPQIDLPFLRHLQNFIRLPNEKTSKEEEDNSPMALEN